MSASCAFRILRFCIFFFSALSRKRIDLMNMLGVYVVMGVGMVVAFMALVAEILWKRKAGKSWFNRVIKLKRRFVYSFLWSFVFCEAWLAECGVGEVKECASDLPGSVECPTQGPTFLLVAPGLRSKRFHLILYVLVKVWSA